MIVYWRIENSKDSADRVGIFGKAGKVENRGIDFAGFFRYHIEDTSI